MRQINDDMIFFSVQDLFGYWKAHVTMSGIQRVQTGIALYAIAHEGDRIGFILNDLTSSHVAGEFLLVDNAAFRDIILYASGEVVDHNRLRGMLEECEAGVERIRPRQGQTIILLGAFWGHGNTVDQYVESKRAGVTIGAYVYDIIPLTHPEYCQPDLVRDHSMSVCEMGVVVDFIFTISDFTRRTLKAFFSKYGGRDIPMRTVPLAHALTSPVETAEAWPATLRIIKGRPFVAYISTIEGRKNHLYVVEAWQRMIEQGVDVPDLVFVGRKGWRVGGLMDKLDGTRYLDGRVHIVHDLSDAELNTIYANCLFTVFTSFVEGWGLPVGESLVHRTPCVASDTSSIPEVGGAFVDYLDPMNLRDGVEVLRRMIEDRSYRDTRRRQIEADFQPRTWDDVGRDFMAATREALQVDYPFDRPLHPHLKEGVQFVPGSLVSEPIRFTEQVPGPMRMALRESFYGLEEHGAWMRGNHGQFSFLTGLEAGAEVIVYLELGTAPIAEGLRVSARLAGNGGEDRGASRSRLIEAGQPLLLRASGLLLEQGLCTVVIEVEGKIEGDGPDRRLFAVGLSAVGFVRADDALRRADLVERFTFHDMIGTRDQRAA